MAVLKFLPLRKKKRKKNTIKNIAHTFKGRRPIDHGLLFICHYLLKGLFILNQNNLLFYLD